MLLKLSILIFYNFSISHFALEKFKVRLYTAINWADFVSWCMLYTVRTKVTKCIREKMTLYFCRWTIKSHSPGYEIGPINRSV